jgi:hypothetical protein
MSFKFNSKVLVCEVRIKSNLQKQLFCLQSGVLLNGNQDLWLYYRSMVFGFCFGRG